VPIVVVVMNNGGHGMVTHGERLQFKGKFSTGKFRQPLDIAAIAAGMGCRSERVSEPGDFAAAFVRALEAEEPVILDVQTDGDAMPPMGMRIQTLDKFFEASGDESAPAEEAEQVPEVVVKANTIPRHGQRTAPRNT
jgi:acetolactate synthase-1/2/3 large subunit